MIKNVIIKNIATYENETFNPNKISYIYGGNGTGKTTLSNIIKSIDDHDECSIDWVGDPQDILVYNRKFIEENFSQNNKLKGIFTLGKDTNDAQKRIDELTTERDIVKTNVEAVSKSIEDDKTRVLSLREDFDKECWNIKKKYDNEFRFIFQGSMLNRQKSAFSAKCLEEKENSAVLLKLKELNELGTKLYLKELKRYSLPNVINYEEYNELFNNTLLETPIVGSSSSQISELILFLNNGDWVNSGRQYLINSGHKCPFCQQSITDDLQKEIEGFFNEAYKENIVKMEEFKIKYKKYVDNIISNLNNIIQHEFKDYDIARLEEITLHITEVINSNLILIDKKINNPSNIIKLNDLIQQFKMVNEIVEIMRTKINNNNELFDNFDVEKQNFKDKVWKYLIFELKDIIDNYIKSSSALNKAILGKSKQLEEKRSKYRELNDKINSIESTITSTEHTKNEINRILVQFGFNSFRIDDSVKKGEYRIVRENGSIVNETLSEGEYRFITFLYFFHLIHGSKTASGLSNKKVVVIDDPISSLDSDILFVVSHLVKDLIRHCKKNEENISQVIVMTHNVYFYKEVTFHGSRENTSNLESFFIIRKIRNLSNISKVLENPIRTSYDMLWSEIKNEDNINTSTIFNTLRRILEYYFNIVGGIDYEHCINKFEGEEKLMCKSLISWINDGSHFVYDDVMVYCSDESVHSYLKVFKMIFEKLDHKAHYNMMMGIAD